MSSYDSRSADTASYRDRRGYLSSSSVKRENDGGAKSPPPESNFDGLTPFEKSFYVEPPSVAAMSESEVDEFWLRREIIVDGKDVPRPIKSFDGAGFPGQCHGHIKQVLSHDADSEVAMAAIISLGLIGAFTNNSE